MKNVPNVLTYVVSSSVSKKYIVIVVFTRHGSSLPKQNYVIIFRAL